MICTAKQNLSWIFLKWKLYWTLLSVTHQSVPTQLSFISSLFFPSLPPKEASSLPFPISKPVLLSSPTWQNSPSISQHKLPISMTITPSINFHDCPPCRTTYLMTRIPLIKIPINKQKHRSPSLNGQNTLNITRSPSPAQKHNTRRTGYRMTKRTPPQVP